MRERIMTTNLFDRLALTLDKPYRFILKHPLTNEPLIHRVIDEEGKVHTGLQGYIDVWGNESPNGIAARSEFDKLVREGVLVANGDEGYNLAAWLLSRMTVGWFLVDIEGNEIDVPFDVDTAEQLYLHPGLRYIWEPLFVASHSRASFLPLASLDNTRHTNFTSALPSETESPSESTSKVSNAKQVRRRKD
jgi:hypothetical protein